MAAGEACQFSYINVAFFAAATGFDTEGFGEAVRVVTRLLDASVEYTIRNHGALLLPLVAQKRRIGVGITGFADLLIRMGVPYDSRAAVDVAAQISELLDYHSKAESVELARARGAFPAFRVSRFLVPEWRARKLPRSTGVIAREDWERLLSAISHVGIRHASTTAMPPTGTSSEIVGSSKSLEPYFALTEQQGKVHRVVREALRNHPDQDVAAKILETLTDGESASLDSAALAHIPYLETARQISPWAHLAIQAGFQRFLDEAMAKTINLPESATPGDVLQSLWMAYRYHLKGLTVFRDNCLENRGASHG